MIARSWRQRRWYDFLRLLCRVISLLFVQIRCTGQSHVPRVGGALLVSNHQSHLDPVLIGMVCPRRLTFLARSSLFRFALLRWLLESLTAIPLDREGTGLAGLKATIKRVRAGEIVGIFPEGTRSPDGRLQRLKPGFTALARRAGVPLIPLAMEGAFDVLPRGALWPRRGGVFLVFGMPLPAAQLADLDEAALLALVGQRIADCHAAAVALRNGPPRNGADAT